MVDAPALEVLGYYTLSAYTVSISELKTDVAKRLPRYPQLPATLIGRLAVDRRHQGKKFGELLLVDALKNSYLVSSQVASLAVITKAFDATAAAFYQRYGFQAFTTEPLKLYLPMQTVEQLCREIGQLG